MAAWMWPAAGAVTGIASSIFSGNQNQKTEMFDPTRRSLNMLIDPRATRGSPYEGVFNIWNLPEVGYGPHRVHEGPSPEVRAAYGGLLGRTAGSPYEAAAGDYATQAIQGGNLYSNPAMRPLGFYGMGGGSPQLWGTPGQRMMMGTAGGAGYNNPYLQGMVSRAMDQAGAGVNSMFGRSGMGGGSAHQQLLARELGGVASDMYGRAYEAERGRQTAMQSALGGLETGRMGLGLQGRGQNIGAATTLGQLFGQERGLQQEAAYNTPGLTSSDLTRLQAGVGAATGLEGYGLRQRQEAVDAWRANMMAPYNRLGFIGSQVMGAPRGMEVTTSGATNPITSALGGALAGYGLYRMGGFGGAPAPTTYSTGAGGGGYNPWVTGRYTPGVPV